MTVDEFDETMFAVGAIWPHWKATASTYEAGELLLMDLSKAAVMAAVRELAVEGPRFAPGLGAIRAKALQSDVPDMDLAWQEVQQNIRRVGIKAVYYGEELRWSSPAVASAVEAMGWKALCESENEVADRAHFFKVYERCAERVRRQSVLPGIGSPVVAELTP